MQLGGSLQQLASLRHPPAAHCEALAKNFETVSNPVRYRTGALSLRGLRMLLQDLAVLIVDDEAIIRMGAAYMLAGVGCVFEAGDAAEALLMLEAHAEIMLVFTDVNMPGEMNGVALASHVYRTKPAIQWIVTSGREKTSDGSFPDHATFLPKPYRQTELVDLVNRKLVAMA